MGQSRMFSYEVYIVGQYILYRIDVQISEAESDEVKVNVSQENG